MLDSANVAPLGRRGRKRKEALDRLLREGLKLMAKRGIAACRVEDITRAAGLAKGTFFTHFPGKDAFVARLTEELLDDLARRVQPVGLMPTDAESLLAAVGAVHWRYFQLNLQAAGFLGQACALAGSNQAVGELWQGYMNMVARMLAPAGEQMGWPRDRALDLAFWLVSSSITFFGWERIGPVRRFSPGFGPKAGRGPGQGLGPK